MPIVTKPGTCALVWLMVLTLMPGLELAGQDRRALLGAWLFSLDLLLQRAGRWQGLGSSLAEHADRCSQNRQEAPTEWAQALLAGAI